MRIGSSAGLREDQAQRLSKQHFHGLDGLRGVAALAVLYLHGAELTRLGYIPPSAGLAVDFFFLLSGFVIAYAYDGRLERRAMTWQGFAAARMTRLYPMLFIGTALGAAVFALGLLVKGGAGGVPNMVLLAAGSFLLLPVGFATQVPNSQAYPLNNPVWSLFFEFAVNGLYGSRFGRLGTRQLIALVVMSGFCLVAAVLAWRGTYQDIGFASPAAFLLGFVRVSYPFWTGVLIFRLVPRTALPRLPVGLAAALLAVLLLLPFGGKVYCLVVVLAVFPLLVAASAGTPVPGPLARLCSWLGELSYPLYLIHQPVFRIITNLAGILHLHAPGCVVFGVGAACSVGAAAVLLVAFDRPVRRWLAARFLFSSSGDGIKLEKRKLLF